MGADEKKASTNLKLSLKRGIENGTLKMAKIEGKNSHKYKLGDNAIVKKPKKIVSLGAKEKKPKKKAGKTVGVKKASKVNKGKVVKKSTAAKKSTSQTIK